PAPPTRRPTRAVIAGRLAYTRLAQTHTKYKLWQYQLIPAFISLVISSALLVGIWFAGESLAGWVDAAVVIETGWLDKLVTIAVEVLAFAVMLVAFFFLHKHIVIVALAPFLGRLAENIIRGTKGEKPTPALPAIRAVQRSAIINTRSIFFELLITIALVTPGFIFPLISPFTTTAAFLVEACYVGYGLIDFPLEYRGFTVTQSIRYTKTHRAVSAGVGTGYLLLMMVPVVGWMFAPTFGTAAGTIETLAEIKRSDPRRDPTKHLK
ncbi:MAG: EI24 domain-containing protein, partial [Verrucomicrobiales bacterium]|nr:EI24 domain-containing protein [Verrucomicrobiales bacterium]